MCYTDSWKMGVLWNARPFPEGIENQPVFGAYEEGVIMMMYDSVVILQPGELEAFAGERGLKVSFTGSLAYPEMVSTLCRCDFAVNPIQGKSAASIINKVGDYAAAALGVVNTQESEEYRALLEQYGAGINCENGNVLELAVAIEQLWENETLRRAMGQGNRQLAEEKFDRGKQYKLLCNLIEMAGAERQETR